MYRPPRPLRISPPSTPSNFPQQLPIPSSFHLSFHPPQPRLKERSLTQHPIVGSKINKLTQNQLDALVSFAFNLGCTPIPKIANFINAGKYKAATDNMLEYVYSGDIKLAGLERRRKAEVALFYTD